MQYIHNIPLRNNLDLSTAVTAAAISLTVYSPHISISLLVERKCLLDIWFNIDLFAVPFATVFKVIRFLQGIGQKDQIRLALREFCQYYSKAVRKSEPFFDFISK